MAISFSRPDPSSPAAVGSASFPTNRRGFDQGEVRDFLRMVAAELARLQERERFLENELRALQTRGMSAPGRLDEETVTTLLGEEAARVLSTARDASTQIRERAEESATRLVKDAAEDAARIRESANIEAARIRDDAAHDAEAEIEMAKQQGRDMVNEARAYREKVLSELSRRRDAARAQIEQLLHGRDRLLNAFERARLASEDVINGLTEAHDEPEFIIDLSPTTGPVPVVNPDHPSGKVFDREVEVVVADDDSHVEEVVIFDHETAEIVDDVIVEEVIEQEPVVDVVIEEEPSVEDGEISVVDADDSSLVADVVETETEAVAPVINPEHPVHGLPITVVEESDDETSDVVSTEQTNVVSLFGRNKRVEDVPVVEVPQPNVEEAATESTDDGADVVVTTPRAADPAVDDIFARLRAGSTETVAASASDSTPAPSNTAAPSAVIPAVVPADPERFAQRDEVLAPLVIAMSRKMKRVLADEQNGVLQHLRAKRSSLDIEAVLGSVEDHAARYASAITEETMAAAGAGAKSVKSAGGSTRRVTQKAVSTHIVDSLISGLIAQFREDTRIAIGEAEGDRDILASLMRDVYRNWKTERLDQHIDDVACSAFSKGGFLSMENSTMLGWMVDPSSPCCSECEDNSLAGAISKGSEFPTGHQLPPAHPGCRCLVCPV